MQRSTPRESAKWCAEFRALQTPDECAGRRPDEAEESFPHPTNAGGAGEPKTHGWIPYARCRPISRVPRLGVRVAPIANSVGAGGSLSRSRRPLKTPA